MSTLTTLFPHDPGPTTDRHVAVGTPREWPAPWTADERVRAAVGCDLAGMRYFAATDPAYPAVPLLPETGQPAPRPPGGIRDKVWQRLAAARIGGLPQPAFAAVVGSRVEAVNAPWRVWIEAVDCRPTADAIRAGDVIVEGAEHGFAALRDGDGVRVLSRSPHVRALLAGDRLSLDRWEAFVDAVCRRPWPLGVWKAAHNPTADLGAVLRACPGTYILKPRHGSNGVGVVRLASAGSAITAASDCPETALYLDELPPGTDVAAAATHRHRFLDRATAGLSEAQMGLSILEGEIAPDRTDGALYEPRVVVQRVSDERFSIVGAICKRITTAVGACVARDFHEEPLTDSLRRFLGPRAPAGELADRVRRAEADLLAAADRVQQGIVPLVAAAGGRIHQFGIDCRLRWNPAVRRVEFPLLEFQFGIGRIDAAALGSTTGYRTPRDLRERFGPEVG